MTAESRAAIIELLKQADPPELRHRGHQLTQTGDPKRQRRWLRRLPNMHTQILRQDRHDASAVVRD